jgi:hypothetical protein
MGRVLDATNYRRRLSGLKPYTEETAPKELLEADAKAEADVLQKEKLEQVIAPEPVSAPAPTPTADTRKPEAALPEQTDLPPRLSARVSEIESRGPTPAFLGPALEGESLRDVGRDPSVLIKGSKSAGGRQEGRQQKQLTDAIAAKKETLAREKIISSGDQDLTEEESQQISDEATNEALQEQTQAILASEKKVLPTAVYDRRKQRERWLDPEKNWIGSHVKATMGDTGLPTPGGVLARAWRMYDPAEEGESNWALSDEEIGKLTAPLGLTMSTTQRRKGGKEETGYYQSGKAATYLDAAPSTVLAPALLGGVEYGSEEHLKIIQDGDVVGRYWESPSETVKGWSKSVEDRTGLNPYNAMVNLNAALNPDGGALKAIGEVSRAPAAAGSIPWLLTGKATKAAEAVLPESVSGAAGWTMAQLFGEGDYSQVPEDISDALMEYATAPSFKGTPEQELDRLVNLSFWVPVLLMEPDAIMATTLGVGKVAKASKFLGKTAKTQVAANAADKAHAAAKGTVESSDAGATLNDVQEAATRSGLMGAALSRTALSRTIQGMVQDGLDYATTGSSSRIDTEAFRKPKYEEAEAKAFDAAQEAETTLAEAEDLVDAKTAERRAAIEGVQNAKAKLGDARVKTIENKIAREIGKDPSPKAINKLIKRMEKGLEVQKTELGKRLAEPGVKSDLQGELAYLKAKKAEVDAEKAANKARKNLDQKLEQKKAADQALETVQATKGQSGIKRAVKKAEEEVRKKLKSLVDARKAAEAKEAPIAETKGALKELQDEVAAAQKEVDAAKAQKDSDAETAKALEEEVKQLREKLMAEGELPLIPKEDVARSQEAAAAATKSTTRSEELEKAQAARKAKLAEVEEELATLKKKGPERLARAQKNYDKAATRLAKAARDREALTGVRSAPKKAEKQVIAASKDLEKKLTAHSSAVLDTEARLLVVEALIGAEKAEALVEGRRTARQVKSEIDRLKGLDPSKSAERVNKLIQEIMYLQLQELRQTLKTEWKRLVEEELKADDKAIKAFERLLDAEAKVLSAEIAQEAAQRFTDNLAALADEIRLLGRLDTAAKYNQVESVLFDAKVLPNNAIEVNGKKLLARADVDNNPPPFPVPDQESVVMSIDRFEQLRDWAKSQDAQARRVDRRATQGAEQVFADLLDTTRFGIRGLVENPIETFTLLSMRTGRNVNLIGPIRSRGIANADELVSDIVRKAITRTRVGATEYDAVFSFAAREGVFSTKFADEQAGLAAAERLLWSTTPVLMRNGVAASMNATKAPGEKAYHALRQMALAMDDDTFANNPMVKAICAAPIVGGRADVNVVNRQAQGLKRALLGDTTFKLPNDFVIQVDHIDTPQKFKAYLSQNANALNGQRPLSAAYFSSWDKSRAAGFSNAGIVALAGHYDTLRDFKNAGLMRKVPPLDGKQTNNILDALTTRDNVAAIRLSEEQLKEVSIPEYYREIMDTMQDYGMTPNIDKMTSGMDEQSVFTIIGLPVKWAQQNVELAKIAQDADNSLWVPRGVADALDNASKLLVKEATMVSNTNTLAGNVTGAVSQLLSIRRRAVVNGAGIPRVAQLPMALFGDTSRRIGADGYAKGMEAFIQNVGDLGALMLPGKFPQIRRYVDPGFQKVMSLDNPDDIIQTPRGPVSVKQMRADMEAQSVNDALPSQDLNRVALNTVKDSPWYNNKEFWSRVAQLDLAGFVKKFARLVEQDAHHKRAHRYYDNVVKKGMTPDEAGKEMRSTLTDWSGGVAEWERRGLLAYFAFWSYTKGMVKHTADMVAKDLVDIEQGKLLSTLTMGRTKRITGQAKALSLFMRERDAEAEREARADGVVTNAERNAYVNRTVAPEYISEQVRLNAEFLPEGVRTSVKTLTGRDYNIMATTMAPVDAIDQAAVLFYLYSMGQLAGSFVNDPDETGVVRSRNNVITSVTETVFAGLIRMLSSDPSAGNNIASVIDEVAGTNLADYEVSEATEGIFGRRISTAQAAIITQLGLRDALEIRQDEKGRFVYETDNTTANLAMKVATLWPPIEALINQSWQAQKASLAADARAEIDNDPSLVSWGADFMKFFTGVQKANFYNTWTMMDQEAREMVRKTGELKKADEEAAKRARRAQMERYRSEQQK